MVNTNSITLVIILVQAAASSPYLGTKIAFPISMTMSCRMPLTEKYQFALKLKNKAMNGTTATAMNEEAVRR